MPDRAAPRASTRLRSLLARDDRVLAVLGTPNAFHAQIMEAAGCETAFVGTGITGGNYTAFPDTGVGRDSSARALAARGNGRPCPLEQEYGVVRSSRTSLPLRGQE